VTVFGSPLSVMLTRTVTTSVVQRASATEVAEALVMTIDGDAVGDFRQHAPHD
jgi:hypothetical protein